MKRFLLLSIALLVASFQVRAVAEIFGAHELAALSNAITELDLERAQKLAKRSDSETPQFLFERARLRVYLGDCVGALPLLSNPAVTSTSDGAQLAQTAKTCANATAAGFVVEDKERGIWLRLQDDADRVLAPFIFKVAAQSRDRIGAELGVDMPRPLRIDLVRDLFSLSAVTGLRLEAAETTGTLAVARFGRIIMLSPQATPSGYHWEDTLAHELTHLLVTRATRDRAPLWLQEGVAKRQENRWREPRPFDQKGWADATAARALRGGHQIGLDKLGPSIAMLPTPEAAATAYAEVQSFVGYFVRERGEAALRLLLADLKGLANDDASSALRSVTGYDLEQWNLLWQKSLLEAPSETSEPARPSTGAPVDARDLARRVRLGDLLLHAGYGREAASVLSPGVAGGSPSYRFRVARAELAKKDPQQAATRLGVETEIDGLYGPWFGLRGRLLEAADPAGAARAFALGLASDPLAEEVACEGRFSLGAQPDEARLPASPDWLKLCEAARKLTRD